MVSLNAGNAQSQLIATWLSVGIGNAFRSIDHWHTSQSLYQSISTTSIEHWNNILPWLLISNSYSLICLKVVVDETARQTILLLYYFIMMLIVVALTFSINVSRLPSSSVVMIAGLICSRVKFASLKMTPRAKQRTVPILFVCSPRAVLCRPNYLFGTLFWILSYSNGL